ncbi:protection of telomeres protein 1 isoform X2 [Kryptolebias marmoratus]|uniref:protection of telomeres protein 1 isoform X2 n=1 Tax=Kryptolebias marmoratus TaxID=37003 RepID=UPI0018ACBD1C|nr:protection of telomeres protein 1 isoform X2 [Kryptolebias marmoratus]
MPVYILTDGTGTRAQIPAHLTMISISLINTSTDCTNKVVKGKVIHKGPLAKLSLDNVVLKTIIQDDASVSGSSHNLSINVFLFGSLAKNFNDAVSQGDVVMASGFIASKSPTAKKDNLHPYNLILSRDDACIYVSKVTKTPKYTYTRLDNLKNESVVNVYGVVVFFKQPFQTRGTDLCSTLKITDQSNENIGCTIFCEKLKDHPRIFQIGDIVRLHRVKAKLFNNSITLVSTFGFSVVTFDGSVGGAVQPRTSSKSFHFDEEDRRTVEELRSWATSKGLRPLVSSTVPLSGIQPNVYFDLTCQLLAKTPIDSTCTLLRVWDGTRCPYTLVEVIAEPGITEGPTSFSKVKESFIANVFVYDNHMEFAKLLKPGDFLRIYNLLATPGSNKVPGLTRSQPVEENHLAFHLHGGTSFGRGIRVLPENSLDVQELKRVFESFPEDPKDELNEVWGTPPESLVCLFLYLLSDGGTVEGSGVFTERSCSHQMMPVTLSQLKQNHPDGAYHVRVQLRSYEPRRLYQSLKLFCSKCSSIQDIPDDESVAGIFSEASQHFETCWSPKWLESRQANLPRSQGFPSQALDVLPCVQLLFQKENKDFIFLNGSTLEETCQFAARVQNIVPVTSSGGHLNLLDLSAPFLFRGRKRYYGCKQCSDAVLRKPSFGREEVIDEKLLAKAFGVQLMQFVLLMKLELQDTTDTLDVFLMKHTELFFSVSAEEASISETAQNRISQIMNILCPPEGSVGQHPWLDLCLTAYRPEGDEGQNQTCYQICNTTIFTQSDPT